MALVFKVKFQETLRRWVVPEESVDARAFSLTLEQVESKIRSLFCLPEMAPISITYVDKDEDKVTLGDDQDLVDACLVQKLNPLRLDVRLLDEMPGFERNATAGEQQQGNSANPSVILEGLLKSLQPEAACDSVKNIFRTFTPFIDPNVREQIMNHAEYSLTEVLNKMRAGTMP